MEIFFAAQETFFIYHQFWIFVGTMIFIFIYFILFYNLFLFFRSLWWIESSKTSIYMK